MNKVILIGRLTAKPELRFTNSNTAFIRFTVAVNRQYSNEKKEADFINIIAWRKQAEVISKYFDKGDLIALEGRLQTSSYEDKGGGKKYSVDVALDSFEFIGTKKAEKKEEHDVYKEYGEQIESELPF